MKPNDPSQNLVRRALNCAWMLATIGLTAPSQAESLVSLTDVQRGGYGSAPHGMAEVGLIQPAATAGNIGGYIKLNLRPGWSLVARRLFDGEEVVGSSFKEGPPGMTVLVGDTTGWRVSNRLDGWSEPDLPLHPGTAAFVFNPNTNGLSVTFTAMCGPEARSLKSRPDARGSEA